MGNQSFAEVTHGLVHKHMNPHIDNLRTQGKGTHRLVHTHLDPHTTHVDN